MKKRILLLIAVMAGLAGLLLYQRSRPIASSAPPQTVAVVDEKALGVLRQADAACKALGSGSFAAEFRAEGVLAANTPSVRGTVQFDAGKDWLKMTATLTDTGGTQRSYDIATDAENVVNVDHTLKSYNVGPYPSARRLLGPGLNLVMPKFGVDAPFKGELDRRPKYEGVKQEGGVACDVISIPDSGKATYWYFGQSDHIPRRVEHVYNLFADANSKDRTILALSDVKPAAAFAQADFQIPLPTGYAESEMSGSTALLTVGTPAPDWELKTPAGQTVRLSQLRGNIVVLDFWATWCGPCKMAMPKVQELHAEYEGRNVKVFGVSCQEDKNADPEGYMKSKNYTYGLLLEGDSVATSYHVFGLPTFYVIDAQGTIVHVEGGAGNEERIKEAVKKAVEKSDT